jgi:hypothetical protein
MSRSKRRILLTVSLSLSLAALAHARAARADECKRIRAEINLTTATIEGNFGLDGTVAFTQDSSGTPPATAPANASVFSGILTITTDRGTISMRETGMSSSRTGNPAGSVLTSWGDSPTGTGRYADVVDGDLFFIGRRVGAAFLVDVTGELCRQ